MRLHRSSLSCGPRTGPVLVSRGLVIGLTALAVACSDGPAGPGTSACLAGVVSDPGVYQVLGPRDLTREGVCIQTSGEGVFAVALLPFTDGSPLVTHDIDVTGEGYLAGPDRLSTPAAGSAGVQVPGAAPNQRPGLPIYEDAPGRYGNYWQRALPVERAHRRRERRTVESLLQSSGGDRLAIAGRGSGSEIPGSDVAGPPAVGSTLAIPTAVNCTGDPAVAQGRVVAVTRNSVVVHDVEAGAASFTDAELRDFGEFFDRAVYDRLGDAFGLPTDIDGNERVVLFFTPASNRLGTAEAGGLVGGFFWGGDLFPASDPGPDGLAPCLNSAEGEFLYLSVPDGVVSREQLFTRSVLAHEFQHLVNAARRVHVNNAAVLEDTWLNEGLSHLAEEIVFYSESGIDPGGNVSEEALRDRDAVTDFNDFVFNNLGRLNVFLLAPHFHSFMGRDGVETRGAAWSFLRYVLDSASQSEEVILRALSNSTTSGRASLSLAGIPLTDDRLAGWGVGLMTDDAPGVPPEYQHPSWQLVRVVSDLRADGRYPLGLVPLDRELGRRFPLRTGTVGFGSFRTRPGIPARIAVRPVDADVPIRAFLIRIQ